LTKLFCKSGLLSITENAKVENMSAFDKLGVTKDDAKDALERIQEESGRKDGRICICGHSNGRHRIGYAGLMTCQAAKQFCPCKQVRLVVSASDTRPFLRKSSGGDGFHALIQGIAAAEEKGIDVEWLVEPKCDKCGGSDGISVVTVDASGFELTESKGYDIFVCSQCRS
jgi:hypothetical protein